jgi:hypothetical protein
LRNEAIPDSIRSRAIPYGAEGHCRTHIRGSKAGNRRRSSGDRVRRCEIAWWSKSITWAGQSKRHRVMFSSSHLAGPGPSLCWVRQRFLRRSPSCCVGTRPFYPLITACHEWHSTRARETRAKGTRKWPRYYRWVVSADLAKRSGVSETAIARLESSERQLGSRNGAAKKFVSIESARIEFIDENRAAPSVRLRKNPRKRI